MGSDGQGECGCVLGTELWRERPWGERGRHRCSFHRYSEHAFIRKITKSYPIFNYLQWYMHGREWAKLKGRGREIRYSIFLPFLKTPFNIISIGGMKRPFTLLLFFNYYYKLLCFSFSAYFSAPLRSDVAGRLSSDHCHAGARDERARPWAWPKETSPVLTASLSWFLEGNLEDLC